MPNVTDDYIRQMPEELRERVAQYQEQRREGQQIMHQLANPPEEGMNTSPEYPMPSWALIISVQILCVIVLLGVIALELA